MLHEDGGHLKLLPKAHYTCSVELDEEIYHDMKSLQLKLVQANKHKFGSETKTIFVEQNREGHMEIDCVAVP